MAASRVLVAISAASMDTVEHQVSVPQLRTMVVIASLQPVNLVRLADAIGVHASNATRACDRLVALGLVDRRDNPDDRRNLTLSLTSQGQRIVTRVMKHRQTLIEQALRRMPADKRRQLPVILAEFAAAAGQLPAAQLWSMGWTTEPPDPLS